MSPALSASTTSAINEAIISKGYNPEDLSNFIMKEICMSINDINFEKLKIMIDNHISHRNLRPENILIKYTDYNKNNFDIKLKGFNFSSDDDESLSHSHVGFHKYYYMAPEVEVNHHSYNNKCVDISIDETKHLSEVLKLNTSLVTLNLRSLKTEYITPIIEALKTNNTLTSISLPTYKLSSQLLHKRISDMLNFNTTLINLDYN